MPKLTDMLTEDRILFLSPKPKFEVLDEMLDAIGTSSNVTDLDMFKLAVTEREKILTTGIGHGLATPHAKILSVSELTMAFGICKEGIDYGAYDNQPIHFIALIAANSGQASVYIKALAKVVKVFQCADSRAKLLAANSPADILALFKSFD